MVFLRVAILHRFYCAMAPMNFSQFSGVYFVIDINSLCGSGSAGAN